MKTPTLIPTSRREQQQADRAYFAERIDLILARKALRTVKRKRSQPVGPPPHSRRKFNLRIIIDAET